jgi:hypothetical protein
MATYIQGQADYITQIQPTEPNLAFDAQILQTKQAKYDANHKKVSDLYGSLLNSAMTRTDNIQARDEFFKIINDDIRRMGGLDFSLDQNVQAAASVFQSIYTNDNIVKDMVWTKNYNNEVSRMEAFKNCTDEEKCGGLYWEEGEKFMQYKRMEFKNGTASQALSMGDVQFTPYRSVMKEAMKLAKDAGLNIEIDELSQDGNYIVTTKNGMKLKSPLTALFNKTIGQNPQYLEMFKTKAYVDRNDWAYSKVSLGEFKDVNEAQLGYLREVNRQNQLKLEARANDLNTDIGNLDQKTRELEEEFANGRFVEGSDKYNELVELKELQQNAKSAKQYLDQVNSVSSTNYAGIEALTDNIDNQNAYTYFNGEIDDAAQTLAFKDYKVSMKADDFAKMKTENKYKLQQMATQHQYDMAEEAQKQEGRIALEDHKKSIGHSSYKEKDAESQLTASNDYITKKKKVDAFDPELEARKKYQAANGGLLPGPNDVATYKGQKLKDYNEFLAQSKSELAILQRDANKAAVKYNKTPVNRDVVTFTDMQTYSDELGYDYATAFFKNTHNQLKDAYKKKHGKDLTEQRFQEAINAMNETDPALSQIKNNLKLD